MRVGHWAGHNVAPVLNLENVVFFSPLHSLPFCTPHTYRANQDTSSNTCSLQLCTRVEGNYSLSLYTYMYIGGGRPLPQPVPDTPQNTDLL